MLSTQPELGTYFAAGTTSEADTVIRSQPRMVFAHHARRDDADRDDTSDSVWRRRIVVRGSDRAVPLPWP